MPRILLASEVGLALILVVGAGLLAGSPSQLYHSDVGFDPHGVVNIAFDMDKQPLTGDALTELYHQIGERLRQQPGVKSLSFALLIPLTGSGFDQPFSVPGGTPRELNLNVRSRRFCYHAHPHVQGARFPLERYQPEWDKIILNQAAADLLFPARMRWATSATPTELLTKEDLV